MSPWCAGREIVTLVNDLRRVEGEDQLHLGAVPNERRLYGRPSISRMISVVDDPMLATPVLAESGVTAALLDSDGVAKPAL